VRTTDDLNPEPIRPLGAPIRKPAAPAQPQWKQVEGATKGVEQGPDGRLRTNLPLPKG